MIRYVCLQEKKKEKKEKKAVLGRGNGLVITSHRVLFAKPTGWSSFVAFGFSHSTDITRLKSSNSATARAQLGHDILVVLDFLSSVEPSFDDSFGRCTLQRYRDAERSRAIGCSRVDVRMGSGEAVRYSSTLEDHGERCRLKGRRGWGRPRSVLDVRWDIARDSVGPHCRSRDSTVVSPQIGHTHLASASNRRHSHVENTWCREDRNADPEAGCCDPSATA